MLHDIAPKLGRLIATRLIAILIGHVKRCGSFSGVPLLDTQAPGALKTFRFLLAEAAIEDRAVAFHVVAHRDDLLQRLFGLRTVRLRMKI